MKTKCRELWRPSLLFGCAQELSAISLSHDTFSTEEHPELNSEQLLQWSASLTGPAGSREAYRSVILKYVLLQQFITDGLRLDNVWNMKFPYDVS